MTAMFDRESLVEALETSRESWEINHKNALVYLAAQQCLARMPEKCERCKGTGEFRYLDSSGPISSDIYPCPTCHGYRRVFPAETVRRVSEIFAAALMPDRGHMTSGAFVALCDAHAFAVLVALNDGQAMTYPTRQRGTS